MGVNFKNQFVMVVIDLLVMSPDINNIAIINVKGDGYCCIIYGVSKIDTIHLLQFHFCAW